MVLMLILILMSKPVFHRKAVEDNITALCPVLMATVTVLAVWQTYRRWEEEF